MNEQAAASAGLAQRLEGNDMIGPNSTRVAFRLNQPDGALDYDLTIDAAIACVTMVPGHLVPSPLETLEQQFLEGEWIHSPQARIEKLRRLGTIPAAKLLGHGSRLPPSPAMPHRYAGTADHKRQPEQGRGGQDHQRKMRCHRSTPG